MKRSDLDEHECDVPERPRLDAVRNWLCDQCGALWRFDGRSWHHTLDVDLDRFHAERSKS